MPEKPVFVIVPGAAFTPAHFGYVSHLLMKSGYGVVSGILPAVGTLNGDKVSVQDDTDFTRERLIMPLLENEERDVIVVGHSYTGIPAGAAIHGLGKSERQAAGKKASVLGQIHIAAIIPKGGDGNGLVAAFGGHLPPHVQEDTKLNLVRCDDPVTPMMQDADPVLGKAAARSTVCPSLTSFNSPVPRASWDSPAFKGRIAYIKTLQDHAVPTQIQDMLLAQTEQEWIIREIDSGHSPSLTQPEKLAELLIEIAGKFESL